MQIDVVDFDQSTDLVTFRCGTEPVVGLWRGEEPPKRGPVYIELELSDDCQWGADIQIEEEGATQGIRPDGRGGCILVGRCVELTYYDVLILSAVDSIVMISTVGEAPVQTEGLLMSVHSTRPAVFPIGI